MAPLPTCPARVLAEAAGHVNRPPAPSSLAGAREGWGSAGPPRVGLETREATFVERAYYDRRVVLAAGSEGQEDELLAPGVYEGPHGH